MIRIIKIHKRLAYINNPHEAITDFKWINESTNESGQSSREAMVNFIDNQKGKAYVRSGNLKAFCYTRRIGNNSKFLQTYSDGKFNDNLLSLPEF